jgi:hypothetical protein
MKTLTIMMAVGLALIGASALYAANDNQFGTAGAQELRIPMGTRNIAMAGSGIADVKGVEAIFWNPAGLARLEGTEASVTHLNYLLDVNVNNASIATRLGDLGSMAFTIKAVTMGDIDVTTEQNPEGTGELFAPGMTVVGLTFARRLTDRVSFGASGMYLNEDIHLVRATGVAFDFGFLYDTQWQGVRFGAVMKNYGPDMRFDGSGFDKDVALPGIDPGIPDKTVRTKSAAFEMPSYVQFGVAYDLVRQDRNHAQLFGSFQSNNYTNDEYRMGAEYGYDEAVFLRAGYVKSDLDEYINDFTLGGGVRVEWGETHLVLDYAWTNAEYFDANQWFSISLEF